jgi:hypothetical protein
MRKRLGQCSSSRSQSSSRSHLGWTCLQQPHCTTQLLPQTSTAPHSATTTPLSLRPTLNWSRGPAPLLLVLHRQLTHVSRTSHHSPSQSAAGSREASFAHDPIPNARHNFQAARSAGSREASFSSINDRCYGPSNTELKAKL